MATFAYQGHGLGMDMGLVTDLDRAATGGLQPDLTVLMDIDIETGLRRATASMGADRMEKRDSAFHERVREGYLGMARERPEQVKIVNADKDPVRIHALGEDLGPLAAGLDRLVQQQLLQHPVDVATRKRHIKGNGGFVTANVELGHLRARLFNVDLGNFNSLSLGVSEFFLQLLSPAT